MDINADEHLKSMTQQDRVECRLFAKLLKTKDGKAFMESLKRDINWDGYGPDRRTIQKTSNHTTVIEPAQSLEEWTGQRRVVAGILLKAQMGERLIESEQNE